MEEEAFEKGYREAKAYHGRAIQFREEGLRSSLIFNVASVAVERYLLALCELYDIMPMNHNYTCLMNAVESVMDFPADLNIEIRSLDRIFNICSIDNYFHGAPVAADTCSVLFICDELCRICNELRIASLVPASEKN